MTKFQKAIYMFFVVVSLSLGTLLLTMSLTYAETILPNTTINGLNVGGLSVSSATKAVEQTFTTKQNLKIQIDEEVIEEEAVKLGVTYQIDQAVQTAYLRGKKGIAWMQIQQLVSSLFTTQNYAVEAQVNKDLLNNFVNENIKSKITEPQDAYLDWQKDTLVIVPDKEGLAIDLDQLKADIALSAQSSSPKVIVAQVKKVQASVRAENLQQYKQQIEKLIANSVVIKAEEKDILLSKAQKASWYKLVKNKDSFQIKVDKEAVAVSVKEAAKTFDLAMVKEQVNSKGEVVGAGRDGKALNQAQVVTELLNSLASQTGVVVTAAVNTVPKEQIVATANDAGVVPAIDTELKFAQVDLGKQMLYLFENRELVNSFKISSGRIGMATPKGVHKIHNKALRPFSKLYGLYLPYWNAITADGLYGIHELPEWPNGYKEGESHLGIPVSHGCIRLGVGAAKYFYEWSPIGMAIVIQ